MRGLKTTLLAIAKSRYWVPIFFVFIVGIGLSTYKDYGISWDERVERLDGAVALRYVEERSSVQFPGLELMLQKQGYPASLDLHHYKDRYYPVGFNLPIEAAIRYLGIEGEQAAYYFRHLFTFSICVFGLWAIFLLAERRFSDWRIGLLASAMYALSPRLYGEWFYNSKDMVLLSLFAMAMYCAISYLQKPNYRNAIFFGVTTALALNIRLMAIILPMLVGGMLIIQIVHHKVKISTAIFTFISSCLVIAGICIALWPLLWESPAQQLVDALRFMANYQFKQDILYFGQIISSSNLPWHYLPAWIAITTPIAYLVFWIVGLIVILTDLFKSKWRLWVSNQQMEDLFFLTLFLAPLIGFMLLRPVIYDGWRHFYFLYPAFLLVAVRGFAALWMLSNIHQVVKKIVAISLTLSLLSSATWMIWVHPLQNVYFNHLIGSNWKSKFDADYWGLSNRRAIEYILDIDDKQKIQIIDGAYNFLPLTLSILNESQSKRIAFTSDPDLADYLITNYRLNKSDHAAMPSNWQFEKHIYAGNEIISSIYKSKRKIYATQVKVGQPISFANNGSGQYFLQSGDWALPESWGVWSQAKIASLYLPIPQSVGASLSQIDMKLRALVSKMHPEQKIAIRINGGAPIIFTLKNLEENLITLRQPLPVVVNKNSSGGEVLKIEIESFNPIEPKKLGMGDDQRLLSIGLISAKFQ